jgi:hypothetical protein
VYEIAYSSVTGKIKGMDKRDHEYGTDLTLIVEDGDQRYAIQMPFSSRYSSSFLKAVPNLNLSDEVKLAPWAMTDKNDPTKQVTGITMYQGGKVPSYYTKEDPNGLPPMVKIKIKGKEAWDDTDMMDFLFNAASKALAAANPIAGTDADNEPPF